MYYDLRDFIEACDKEGECKRVEGADWNVEIFHITELATYLPQTPLLVFDKIKGYPEGYRVVTNMCSTTKRMAMALGLPRDLGDMDLIKTMAAKFRAGFKPVPPVEVKTAPIKENVIVGDKVDLFKFPVPKFHPLDGGRYIGTGDMGITRDPDTGWVNFGCYRTQVHDKSTITCSLGSMHSRSIATKYWDRGQACPVVLVCGQDPLLFQTSMAAVPTQVGEYDYAGWLGGEPIKVIKGETTDLPIPATAEIALEFEVPPPGTVKTVPEGPFAEWEGYNAEVSASGKITYRQGTPVKVKAILHRNNPILHGAPPLHAKNGEGGWGRHVLYSANLWSEMDKHLPGVKGVYQIPEARDRLIIAVSIKQMYPGHAKQAAMLVSGLFQGMSRAGRVVIVVDDDIDPSNKGDILFALATRWDPATQTDIMTDCTTMTSDPMVLPEHRESGYPVCSRAFIYACKPYSWIKEFPIPVKSSPQVLEETARKWGELLFGKDKNKWASL